MGKSTLQIPKVCPLCGCTFLAKTVKTVYCSEKCSYTAQNEKRKQDRKQRVLDNIKATGTEYITIKQALQIFTTTRSTIRRLIMKHRVSYRRPSPRKTFVSVKSLETLFPLRPESQVEAKQSHTFDMRPDHCYTIGEISQRFQVTEYSVYKHIRQFSIPTRQVGRFVYAPKTEIDNLYSNKKSKK